MPEVVCALDNDQLRATAYHRLKYQLFLYGENTQNLSLEMCAAFLLVSFIWGARMASSRNWVTGRYKWLYSLMLASPEHSKLTDCRQK